MAYTPLHQGLAIAHLLATSWRERPEPPPEGLGQDVALVAETLLGTGGGALAWWRLRGSPLETVAGAEPLHEAFRLHTLQAAVHQRNVEHILLHFNAASLTPILFKGWSIARLYARPGLRPYGDVDVLVEPENEARARATIAGLPGSMQKLVDLDMRVLKRFLPDRSLSELLARAVTEEVGSARFLTLAPEDHLRLVCLHQLDHGAWRPLWLTDVAVFLEALPAGFRWDVCLAGNPRLSDAVLALVALAIELLDANPSAQAPRTSVPGWFRKAMLRAWGGGFQAPPDSLFHLRHLGWRRATAAVRGRWPDPITSTLHLRAPFRAVPRPLLQVAEMARRGVLFLRRWTRERGAPAQPVISIDDQGKDSS